MRDTTGEWLNYFGALSSVIPRACPSFLCMNSGSHFLSVSNLLEKLLLSRHLPPHTPPCSAALMAFISCVWALSHLKQVVCSPIPRHIFHARLAIV